MSIILQRVTQSLILIMLLVIASSGSVSAHVLKQNNGISAVLHVPPEDNPTAGEKVELNIAFGDKTNKFNLMNCNCKVLIQSDGQTINTYDTKPALEGATEAGSVDTVFPKPGIYHVLVTGQSTNDSFQTFRLDYTLRVSADSANRANSKKPTTEIAIIGVGSILIIGMFAYNGISFGERYKPVSSIESHKSSKGAKTPSIRSNHDK